ncbi:hypothetical protein CR513_02675, partial [Mucuna pruriens]
MEKELLPIVFALDKFRAYLLDSKVIIFSDHATLKYLLKKRDAKSRLIWSSILKLKIKRIKGKVDLVPIRDDFPDEQLLLVAHDQSWFVDICNFFVASTFSPGASKYYKEKIQSDAKYYIWDNPYIWRCCNERVFWILRAGQSPIFAILHLEVATMDPPEWPEKYLNVDSIGPLFFEMCTNLSRPTNSVKRPEWK